ncbi:amino acid ABC transporter membrane protein (PAAT family) [Bosea psychrotolerans]|uniref:Glutamate/aspartate import permease protein GltK n=2 Tax=Bosea psychrotolerans TaxID=1871628 RepID=A0A2S4LXK1_9HYPH|nr:amino acid ABC transporter permease [Bosea psychrotolerans]POR47181.1 amino acid ABC transporter membrane protein (PAAT family) [Bosea psychrotolerans]
MSATTTDSELPVLANVARVKLSHPSRWVVAIACLVGLALIVRAFALGQIEWTFVGRFLTAQAIVTGFANTMLMTILAMALGILLGLIAALMRLSVNPVARVVAGAYIWFFRGTPVYLQLLLWFNLALIFPTMGIPGLWEARTVDVMTPFLAALLGLGVCQGAYTAEVIRAGITSVDAGQVEAAKAVGMTGPQVMRHVVLPQALRVITPPIGNEVIGMLKHTSLAAVISYNEIMHTASMIYFVNNRVIEMLIVCSIYYLATVTLLSIGQSWLERHLGRAARRTSGAAPAIQGEPA